MAFVYVELVASGSRPINSSWSEPVANSITIGCKWLKCSPLPFPQKCCPPVNRGHLLCLIMAWPATPVLPSLISQNSCAVIALWIIKCPFPTKQMLTGWMAFNNQRGWEEEEEKTTWGFGWVWSFPSIHSWKMWENKGCSQTPLSMRLPR